MKELIEEFDKLFAKQIRAKKLDLGDFPQIILQDEELEKIKEVYEILKKINVKYRIEYREFKIKLLNKEITDLENTGSTEKDYE